MEQSNVCRLLIIGYLLPRTPREVWANDVRYLYIGDGVRVPVNTPPTVASNFGCTFRDVWVKQLPGAVGLGERLVYDTCLSRSRALYGAHLERTEDSRVDVGTPDCVACFGGQPLGQYLFMSVVGIAFERLWVFSCIDSDL